MYQENTEYDYFDDMQALVYDIGSEMMKLGFSGDDAPRAVFPTIVGRPKYPGIMVGMDAKDCFVGDEAQAKRGILNLNYPVKKGIVTDFKDMEKVFHHCPYNELCVTPEEHPLLLSEAPRNPKQNREKLAEMHFEVFNVPALAISVSNVLSLYASGRTSGIVLDFGGGANSSVPIYEGYGIKHACEKNSVGSSDVTDYMVRLIQEKFCRTKGKKGFQAKTSAEREIVRDIKEKLGFVAYDYEKENSKCFFQTNIENNLSNFTYRQYCNSLMSIFDEYKPLFNVLCPDVIGKIHEYYYTPKTQVNYELPDGSNVAVDSERFKGPEIYFKPSLIGKNTPGIHEVVVKSIRQVDIDLHTTLLQNLVIAGGGSMFNGIVRRLRKEVQNLLPKNARVKIKAPAERKFSTWIGGSILSSLSSFRNEWMTKGEYDEHGPAYTHRKFFA